MFEIYFHKLVKTKKVRKKIKIVYKKIKMKINDLCIPTLY